jgi:hypothetical protein
MVSCAIAGSAAGCMTTTETSGTAPVTDGASSATGPIAAGKARLTLTRVTGILYVGAPATVKINGEQVASLWAGSSSSIDIAPGATSVSVDGWTYPGSWTVDLSVKAGQSYTIEISPRGDSLGPNLLLGAIGGAIDASVNQNAGLFQARVLTGQGNGRT